MWSQVPPPQSAYGQAPPPHPYYAAAPVAPAASDEVRTLWMGDLQYWMDDNYIYGCFASTGKVYVSMQVLVIDPGSGGNLQLMSMGAPCMEMFLESYSRMNQTMMNSC